MPWGEDPPPPNVLIDKMISAMAADLRKDIELLEREQDRMITLLQQIIEENRRIRQMWQEVPIVHLSSEVPSNNAMAPNSSDQARNISTSSILQNIKREPSDEVDARADEGYLQKLKAAPSRFADHTSRKRIAKNTSHLYQKSPRFTGSPRATPCRILKQEIKDEPREDNDSLPTLDEPIDEDEPYTGDVEVEKAIYYDSSNVVDYASRLANFVFEGLPEMPYSKLPRNRREWVNEMVERRYPCPASENTKKYAEKWHRNVILRRVKTIRRLENIDFNLDALLSYGSMPSKIGRLLSIAFVPPNLEHEAFLNSSDELQYAIRLSTLLWPLTGKPPIQTDGLDREDEERFKYLSVALDERYPIAKDNSEKRCESILKKIREKN